MLYTDASGDGIGGCLHVISSDGEKPVAFFSRQLRPAEKNYSVTELESLAIVASISFSIPRIWTPSEDSNRP